METLLSILVGIGLSAACGFRVFVPLLIFASGAFMSFAWLGHLRFKERGFWFALVTSWLIVLPEYVQYRGTPDGWRRSARCTRARGWRPHPR